MALLLLGGASHLHATVNGPSAIPPITISLSPVAPSESQATPVIHFSVPRYQPTEIEKETVAACLVLEAANQGEHGMRSVMAVIRNRARGLPEIFALTVLRPKQFSALNLHTSGQESLWRVIQRAKRDRTWPLALALVEESLDDRWQDPTGGATHYTRTGERTPWTRRLAKTAIIGEHAFYR